MWITYLVISTVCYAAAKGAASGSVSSFIGSLFFWSILCGAGYFLYIISPYGKMIEKVKPNIEEQFIAHRKHMHSYFSRNALTISIAFLAIGFSSRLSSYYKTVESARYVYDGDFYAIVTFLIGLTVLFTFKLKYKNLARSEKREMEYLDDETKRRYKEEIDIYFINEQKNPILKYIEYLGGYPEIYITNTFMALKIDGNKLNAVRIYDNSLYFSIFIPDIVDIRHNALNSQKASTSFYDEMSSSIKMMYIDCEPTGGSKFTLQFSTGMRKTLDFENRIMDIKYDYQADDKSQEHQESADTEKENIIENISNEENIEIPKSENLSIEERLDRLKSLWDKELINEADYTKRKEEILKEI
ncbi:MAG: hypothetical protein AB1Z23_00110 [Eubacteriales bacterium]